MYKYQHVSLFIRNLDDTIDEQRLKKEFSKFGIITNVKVISYSSSIDVFFRIIFTFLLLFRL